MLPLVLVGAFFAWRFFTTQADTEAPLAVVTPAATLPVGTAPPSASASATAIAQGGRPPATTPRSTATPTPRATAVPAAGRTPAPTAAPRVTPAPSPRTGVAPVVVAYDSFPSYHTWAYAARKGYAGNVPVEARGFGFEEDNPTEAEKFARLRSGRYQALVTTLDSCALQCDDSMVVPFVIDESAGADEWYVREPIRTFNDLAGKRVCFTERTVSHAMYVSIGANLDLLDKMQAVPRPDVNAALDAFNAGACDSVLAWVPNTEVKLYQGGNLRSGVRKLTDSSRFRFVLDVPIFNKRWATERPEQAQALTDAYFRALKDVQENPESAGQFLLDSFKNTKSVDNAVGWSEWSGIEKKEDLRTQLGTIAQATLGQNRLALNDPGLLASRIAEFRTFWTRAGVQGSSTDPAQLVDNRFLLKASDSAPLAANTPPVNASFSLATKITMPRLSDAELGRTQEVAKLPVERIGFRPDSFEILPASQRSLLEMSELLRRTPGLYLFIDGRAAKPLGSAAQETIDVAQNRANAVANFLAAQPGIDINRLVVTWPRNDAELRQKLRFYDSFREDELEQDRLVIFTLRQAGGQ